MTTAPPTDRMPVLYLGHGAPPLVDDALWPRELAAWAEGLPRPSAVLMVSAHWESAPLTLGATETGVPLTYDFWGFPEKYYRQTYRSPGAPALAAKVKALVPDTEPVAEEPARGLDHGAYVPLSVMYPAADVPVLQMSMPTLDPQRLFDLGRRLAPLRDEGVLVVGSGFLTHGLPFVRDYMFTGKAGAPGWSRDFDLWATEALRRGAIDELIDYQRHAPGLPWAHPTAEHLAPLYVALGAATDPERSATTKVEGYWMGLAKRSFQLT